MKVTVTTLSDDSVFVLDVSEELELENFKAFCEIESGVPAHEIVIAFNGLPLMDDKKSLRDHGIHDGDAVILQHMHQSGSDLNLQPFNRGGYEWLISGLSKNFASCTAQRTFAAHFYCISMHFTIYLDRESARKYR